MPAVTITDLENAKTDVDHIADFANSPAPTATDRLGQVKKTIAGISADLNAAADLILAEVQQAADDAAFSLSEIVSAIDSIAVAGLPEFTTIALGIDGTTSGQRFLIAQQFGAYKNVYINQAGVAKFSGTAALGLSGRQVAAALAKNTELFADVGSRPAYEYNMIEARAWDGRLVPNRGTKGMNGDPRLVINAGASYALDNDGAHTGHDRIVNDPLVTDPLGRNEAISVTFGATSHHLTILSRFDNDSATHPTPARDLVVTARFLQKGATVGKLAIGSSSAASGEKTMFDTSGAWTERTVTMAAWEGVGKAYGIVIRPQAGASGEGTATFPFEVSIFDIRVTDPLSGETLLSMEDLRASRRAGHALAPHALPGSIDVSVSGEMTPNERTPNLMAELDPQVVTGFHMYMIVKVDTLPASSAGAVMAFSRTENVNETPYNQGRLGMRGSTEDLGSAGRINYFPNNSQAIQICPVYLHGSGYMCVARNYGATADWVPAGEVIDELFTQGVQQYQRSGAPIAANFSPRLMSIGGQDASMKAYQGGVTGVVGPGTKIVKVVYEPNVQRTPAEVLARFQADLDTIPALAEVRSGLKAATMFDGDSTMDFRGSPPYETGRAMRGPGRLFLNHSRGGAYFSRGNNVTSSTHYLQTRRTNMRKTAFKNAIALGYRRAIYAWCPGENEFNSDAALGLSFDLADGISLLDTWVFDERDEINAWAQAQGYAGRLLSVLITMKVSHTFDAEVRAKIDAYCAARRAVYSQAVDAVNAPLLFKRPNGASGRGYDYMIDMNAWAPRLQDGSTTWANWSDLAAQAFGKVNSDPDPAARIISGDGQHWTQNHTTYNEGNPHAAAGVHIPSLTKIFQLEGVA